MPTMTAADRITAAWPVEIVGLPGNAADDDPSGARSFHPRATVLADEWDDDPIGELDDETLVVLTAMAEVEEEAGLQSSQPPNPHPWVPAPCRSPGRRTCRPSFP